MSLSANPSTSSELESRRLSAHTRAILQGRLRYRLYNFIMAKFRQEEASGLTRAELARRTGKAPAVITRYLSGPGNWTIDTVSDLLAGIAGEELLIGSAPPIQAQTNIRANDLPDVPEYRAVASASSGTSDVRIHRMSQ